MVPKNKYSIPANIKNVGLFGSASNSFKSISSILSLKLLSEFSGVELLSVSISTSSFNSLLLGLFGLYYLVFDSYKVYILWVSFL